ncbi:MAG: hypothetical protein ACUVTR_00800 [Dehalococcoidia bacterium]
MMKKILSILLAVALGLSFSVVATPAGAESYYAELVANITAPANGVEFMGGAEFIVNANVTNNGTGYAKDVKATITISGNATLKAVAGNVATKNVAAELPAENGTAEVSWTLVCTGAGAVNITVTPSGIEPNTLNPIKAERLHSDTVTINQTKVLEVTILEPVEPVACNVTEEFDVTANVKNVSSLNATDVTLTISIDRYAEVKAGAVTRTVGALNGGVTSANYTWTVRCTADGFSRITVTPAGKVEGTAIPALGLTADTVTVSQGVFDVANITLAQGWNLISLPIIPLDSAINVVVAGILDNLISVWHYDAAAKRWYSFAPGVSSDLTSMRDGKAYWVNMKAPQTLSLAGRNMSGGGQLPPAYDVVVGWNMVGFKSTTNMTAAHYLSGNEYVRIYGFKNGAWFTIPDPYTSPEMEPGLGYWVAFTKAGTIYP